MAEFLYCRTQMSASNIDTLLDLWASTLLKHDDTPPFANHSDLYDTIDSTPIGDVPWQSFSLKYDGELPDSAVPQWMTEEYEVWFRDPHLIAKNMVGNPDYKNGVDTAPVQIFDSNGDRTYQNFMSGDWASEEAVSFKPLYSHLVNSRPRTKLLKTLKLMVLCSFCLFLVVIKQQYQLRLAIMNTTHFMGQLGPSKTISAELTAALLL
jgi:hypothetical protein